MNMVKNVNYFLACLIAGLAGIKLVIGSYVSPGRRNGLNFKEE